MHDPTPPVQPPVIRAAHPHPGQVVIMSFGYRHGPLPPEVLAANITVDVRDHLRDPHVSPELRELTGHDVAVWTKVMDTPGAVGLIAGLTAAAHSLLPGACRANRLVTIAIGCAGGRHRSVVIADAIAESLAALGWGAEAEHLHINRPVVER